MNQMNLRLSKFNELLQDLGLYHDYHQVLVDNGFDNWESITYLNAATLEDMGTYFYFSGIYSPLGIKDDIKVQEILACIEAASVIKDQEEVLSESSENLRPEPDLIEEVKSGNRSRSDSRVSTEGFKRYYPITENILMKGTSLKKDRKESNEKFFGRVIQMYLNEKGITHIVRSCFSGLILMNRTIYTCCPNYNPSIFTTIKSKKSRIWTP